MMHMMSNMTNGTHHHTTTTPHHHHDNQGIGHGNTHGGGHQMYFTVGNAVTIIFEEWKTDDDWELVVSCLALLVIAFLYEGLKVFREHLVRSRVKESIVMVNLGAKGSPQYNNAAREASSYKPTAFSCLHLVQTMLHMIQVFVGYALMLAVMTFNAWICIAIILGSGLGYFAFGWLSYNSSALAEHCN